MENNNTRDASREAYDRSIAALRNTRVDRNIATAISDYIRDNYMGMSALAVSVGVAQLAGVIREQLIAEMVAGRIEIL